MFVARALAVGGFALALFLAAPAHAQRVQHTSGPLRPIELPSAHAHLGPGQVVAQRKISNESGDLPDSLDGGDRFGSGAAVIGDLDGDGRAELAIGARGDVSDGALHGAVWVLSLDPSGQVERVAKIESDESTGGGSFAPEFGGSIAALGDLDGDAVPDLAVGSSGADDGGVGSDQGAVTILFLNADGSARARQRISDVAGGFTGRLDNLDLFGAALACLGDVDGDGVVDLAVGASGDDDGGTDRGAVWLLFLNANGTVKAHQKISATQGGFAGTLGDNDRFGLAVSALGDLDGDGHPDLAVGAPGTDGTFLAEGAVWILFLGASGTVLAEQEISSSAGGFGGTLDFIDLFGSALANLGDLDGDGIVDLGVGSRGDQDGGVGSFDHRGAAYVLFLASDGTVRAHQKISLTQGGFTGSLTSDASFGSSLASLGDLDGDGTTEVAAGAPDMGPDARGIVWMLSLVPSGTVAANHAIRDGLAGFPPSTLENSSGFGRAIAALGDLDGDGAGDLAVGAALTSLGANPSERTSIWVLLLAADGSVESYQEIADGVGGLPAGALSGFYNFGMSLAPLGDLDGDGVNDLAAGVLEVGGSGGAGTRLGTTFILFLEPDGTVREHRRIQLPRVLLHEGDEVGRSLAALGDLDGDGVVDLIAGAPGDDDGPGSFDDNRGGAWVLFLNANGTLKSFQKISPTQGGFTGLPENRSEMGDAAANLGDVDGDGVVDVALGASFDDDGGVDRGAVWVLFLRSDGTVRAHAKISSTQGGFTGALPNGVRFGSSLAGPGDLDGDGVRDLVVGAPSGTEGSAWVLLLASDGTARGNARIGAGAGGFTGALRPSDAFGSALANLGDVDGDGVTDLGVGARGDDDGGAQHGAVWLLALDGVACIDFSAGDDQERTRLVNGQALGSPGEFGRTLALSSTGANLGPAIFDSTPLGPNDPSQDRDLLVGLGNVLILQNSQVPTQSIAGIFDRPNDDQDGGTVTFRFARGPVAAFHLDLVDIDLGATQSARVTLVDALGRTRTYSIPAGWTEDLLTHGPPAFRTLDLTRIDPQAGFVSSATASETPGFDPRRVARVEVELGSSGAIDNLCFDPHPDE